MRRKHQSVVISVISAVILLTLSLLPGHVHATEDTLLRSGDVIEITFPGESAFDEPHKIRTDGSVTLPEIGKVFVKGLTIEEVQTRISEALAIAYKGVEGIEVALLERRLIVQVLGYVKQPGKVDLNEQANVQAALVAAGGLLEGAQLDRMQLRRHGKIQYFNYKSYLDSGDLQILPSLQPGDVIFAPASPLIGNVQVDFDAQTLTSAGDAGDDDNAVRVFGEVQKPGTFSYREGQSVIDLIMRAGGPTRYAGVEKIRVMNGDAPLLFDLKSYLDIGKRDQVPILEPGSTIYVPIRVDDVKSGSRTVYVMGEVASPGAYEMTDGANFFDVLANSGGPNRYADSRQLRIIRADGSVKGFDLVAYTEGHGTSAVPEIRPGDAIFVPEKADQLEPSWLKVGPERAIRIIGAVEKPGRYEWSAEMSLLDLLAHAGGPNSDADISQLRILAVDSRGHSKPSNFDLEDFLSKGGSFDRLPMLRAGYTVMVPELPKDSTDNKSQWVRQSSDRSIYVMGAVGSPGRYAFNEYLNFLDILAAADGPSAGADIQNIRVSHRGAKGARISKTNLALYFETGDEAVLPMVLPGDVIYVPERDRAWTEIKSKKTVRVLGAVGSPGRYDYDESMTLLDLLAESGGPTVDAWQEQIVVVNLSSGRPEASSFDLVEFAKTGDFAKLPVVRTGDTIYVPTISQSNWSIFMSTVRDAVQVLSILALAGVI